MDRVGDIVEGVLVVLPPENLPPSQTITGVSTRSQHRASATKRTSPIGTSRLLTRTTSIRPDSNLKAQVCQPTHPLSHIV